MLCLSIIVFSTFIEKELCTAKNIKDRLNRHNVVKILTKIFEFSKNITFENGIFIYAGINDNKEFIFEYIIPNIKSHIFIYNCSNKFILDYIDKYIETYDGSIIFVNGNECIIYDFKNKFNKFKHINGNLIKKHKKGGYSSNRFQRLSDESKTHYVTHIIDYLNLLKTNNNWIFGSNDMITKIFERKNDIYIKLNNGGFVDFNNNTINDSKWIDYIKYKINNDKYYEKVCNLLNLDVDMLDFDINNKNMMEFYIVKNKLDNSPNEIILDKSSIYYEKLIFYEYIGVKYFNYNLDED